MGTHLSKADVAWKVEIQTKDLEMKRINKDFLMDLERERLDQSYKNRITNGPVEYTKIIYRDRAVDHRFRDNIMYQAGRYAMGARDDEATNGNKVAGNLINKKGKK
jgi:hypothetical protein